MASEVVVVHANETPPESWDASVFLAGPLPRAAAVPSWNPDAIALLRERWRGDGRLVVFTPEPRGGLEADYIGQIEWEHRGLHQADVILFWVPREPNTMPAYTTNIEWGTWYDSGKVVFGAPPSAPRNEYLRYLAAKEHAPVADELGDAVDAALGLIGSGSRRGGGERAVPLLVWRTESFQNWHAAQREAGNTLEDARLEWTFRVGPDKSTVVYWAAHVTVRVAAEDRLKSNEVVISRPDTAHVALYVPGPSPEQTTVVLVREFRSPASTPDGYVHELPGGSGNGRGLVTQAAEEVREETGFAIGAERLRPLGSRQVAGTVSAHRAHLFAAEITEAELEVLRELSAESHGVGGGEVTWIEITTYGEILANPLADWATVGMIAQALA
ncbi:nucleoside 2-deoxyribosyltransferase domain-containing protein [Glycomyces sp. NPDC046736]|uniref:nucleoside 2-deoxyribosyltransferase domain-containing protein n=1 Tax=Glycomyces sp. NPDC046736 TaxID=3155615 RepID=UPI0033D285A5